MPWERREPLEYFQEKLETLDILDNQGLPDPRRLDPLETRVQRVSRVLQASRVPLDTLDSLAILARLDLRVSRVRPATLATLAIRVQLAGLARRD